MELSKKNYVHVHQSFTPIYASPQISPWIHANSTHTYLYEIFDYLCLFLELANTGLRGTVRVKQ